MHASSPVACIACFRKCGDGGAADYLPAGSSSFICLVLLVRVLLVIGVSGLRVIAFILFLVIILAKMPVGWATGFRLPLLYCCFHLSILLSDAKLTLLLLRVIA